MKLCLITYKVTADHKPFWSAIIQAESYYDALAAASKQFDIPFKKLSAQLWASTSHS